LHILQVLVDNVEMGRLIAPELLTDRSRVARVNTMHNKASKAQIQLVFAESRRIAQQLTQFNLVFVWYGRSTLFIISSTILFSTSAGACCLGDVGD